MALKYAVRDERGWITGSKYPPEKVQTVLEKYPNHTAAECVEFSGLTKTIVYNIARKYGIEKSEAFRQKQRENTLKHGANTRFTKGRTPENKGKKWNEYMSPEGKQKSLKSCFKKGHIPNNHRPVGSERINVEGYIEIKIQEPNVWEQKHRVVWEQHYGKIPKGCNIQFQDGNRQNCDIENLYMISRENQARENSIHNYPEDVKKAIRTVSKLSRTIKNIRK
jgi:hypothetical protein